MICVECGKPIPMPTADAFRCPSCRTRARIDGGAAFPSPTANQSQNGQLTVRDYFAGQVVIGLAANETLNRYASGGTRDVCGGFGSSDLAALAYNIADALIAERAK